MPLIEEPPTTERGVRADVVVLTGAAAEAVVERLRLEALATKRRLKAELYEEET